MKRFVTVIAAMVLAATVLMGADNSGKYLTKSFDFKNFSGIEAGGLVNVNVVKSDVYKVNLKVPDILEPYLRVKVQGDELKIGLENVPSKISRKIGDMRIEANVSMPVLRSLELSGVAQFRSDDEFEIPDRGFKLETEGASRVNKLIVNARDIDAEIQGASYVSLDGVFDTAEVDMSGASKALLGVSAGKIAIDLSGASKPTLRGEFDEISLEISGASEFNWTGSARKMRVEVSGASKVRASGCPVNEVFLEASGAAKCDVNALDYLSIDASGASAVHYVAHEGLKIDLVSVSRAASVTKTR